MANRLGFSWLANFDITQLLLALRNDCSRIPHAGDRATLEAELDKLAKQSKLQLGIRNQKEIACIWRKIHSDLRYYGILNTYDHEPVRTRIINFLKGQPIEAKHHL